ncbi:hypothetical protein GWI33_004824 [Rhynchophorus ferrugineus]|uniref:Uncharacterized protein n=1 Tax=Rhynchophorus ferrugineus TaxID=354439 RepID=A0A834MEA8_RHYFE|nr:hypothetical protein GWI33_004824 [Rhynchophorus ferrugineus]
MKVLKKAWILVGNVNLKICQCCKQLKMNKITSVLHWPVFYITLFIGHLYALVVPYKAPEDVDTATELVSATSCGDIAINKSVSARSIRDGQGLGLSAYDHQQSLPAKMWYPSYEYGYSIEDRHSGDIHGHREFYTGNHVVGQYFLHDADGTVRIVTYYDVGEGFNVIIRRQRNRYSTL